MNKKDEKRIKELEQKVFDLERELKRRPLPPVVGKEIDGVFVPAVEV